MAVTLKSLSMAAMSEPTKNAEVSVLSSPTVLLSSAALKVGAAIAKKVLPWWSPVPSAPPWWPKALSTPPWGTSATPDLLWWCSAPLWGSSVQSAPLWWSSALSFCHECLRTYFVVFSVSHCLCSLPLFSSWFVS